jgi:hypothetical protein
MVRESVEIFCFVCLSLGLWGRVDKVEEGVALK